MSDDWEEEYDKAHARNAKREFLHLEREIALIQQGTAKINLKIANVQLKKAQLDKESADKIKTGMGSLHDSVNKIGELDKQ